MLPTPDPPWRLCCSPTTSPLTMAPTTATATGASFEYATRWDNGDVDLSPKQENDDGELLGPKLVVETNNGEVLGVEIAWATFQSSKTLFSISTVILTSY